MNRPDPMSGVDAPRPAGVRAFRVQVSVLIAVYTILVYGGIYFLTQTLLMDSIRSQAASYTSLVLDTRMWNASNGGVWVLKSDDAPSNPYLAKLGIPADIETVDGTTLTLRNHSTMTREISEISRSHRGVWFHLTARDYINPTNAPDEWESLALARIDKGEPTVEGISEIDGQRAYRVAAGLVVDADCLHCHRDQGYRVGDTRGAVTVNVPMDQTDTALSRAASALTALGLLTMTISLVAVNILASRMQRNIRQANAQLAEAAITDALTGVLNRGATLARLAEEFERSRRENQPLSVLMLDLDDFKRINDNYGHAAGDCALREFVVRVRGSVRAYDAFGRVGGEEFLVVSPGTDATEAEGLAERILDAVRATPIGCDAYLILTASVGVAGILETDSDIDVMLARADAALYRAKHLGRDRVVVAGRPD